MIIKYLKSDQGSEMELLRDLVQKCSDEHLYTAVDAVWRGIFLDVDPAGPQDALEYLVENRHILEAAEARRVKQIVKRGLAPAVERAGAWTLDTALEHVQHIYDEQRVSDKQRVQRSLKKKAQEALKSLSLRTQSAELLRSIKEVRVGLFGSCETYWPDVMGEFENLRDSKGQFGGGQEEVNDMLDKIEQALEQELRG